MNFDHSHYVPCLRWKQGEYQAVSRLRAETKRAFTPLIEVPEIGWDFENEKEAKTIDQHLAPVAERIHKKWGNSLCFVDLDIIDHSERLPGGVHPVDYVFDGLRAFDSQAVPVTGLDRDKAYQDAVKNVADKDKAGVCLRIGIEQAANKNFGDNLTSLLSQSELTPQKCDFVLDLGTPNFVPLTGFSKAIGIIVRKLPNLDDWRSFTVLGTSFPETMASIKKGGELVPRCEWQFYRMLADLCRKAGLRRPTFGDYAIAHPKVLYVDMRLVKPYATVRYTIDDYWHIVKGKNIRDYGRQQFRGLCKQIVKSSYYCGSAFSWGDKYIEQCAKGTGSTGSLMMWRQVGTNHHIEKVTQDLASFYAS